MSAEKETPILARITLNRITGDSKDPLVVESGMEVVSRHYLCFQEGEDSNGKPLTPTVFPSRQIYPVTSEKYHNVPYTP